MSNRRHRCPQGRCIEHVGVIRTERFGRWLEAFASIQRLCRAINTSPWRWFPRGFLLPAYGNERSEEHTSELQSQSNLVCRLLLEKKNRIAPSDMSGRYLVLP